jgi:hypothetical protein
MKTVFTAKEIAAINAVYKELNRGIVAVNEVLDADIPLEDTNYLELMAKAKNVKTDILPDGSFVFESPEELILDVYNICGKGVFTLMVSIAQFIKPWMGMKDMVVKFIEKWYPTKSPSERLAEMVFAEALRRREEER